MISDVEPIGETIRWRAFAIEASKYTLQTLCRHYSANACLTPVCAVYGKAVTTVEGIGSVASGRLHPVQERLSK